MQDLLGRVVRTLDGKSAHSRGQSLVELTVTLPILILMVLSMTEIGFLANNYLTLMDVVREAGRRAVNLDPRAWPDNEARNWHRLDCDRDPTKYDLFPGQYGGSPGQRDDGNPRGPGSSLGYFKGQEDEFGFFDGTACQAIFILDPLKFDDSASGKDDIVISAVSFALMDYKTIYDTAPGQINSDFGAKIQADPRNGYRVTVTGRYPLENRMCLNSDGSGDVRDPFDYKRTEYLNNAKNGATNPDTHEPGGDGESDLAAPRTLTDTSQGVRGFVLTGKSPAGDSCIGSQFTVQAIEERLNLSYSTADLASKVPNGGLIIVEFYWQHHPLFLGPIFRGFSNSDRTNDPVLYIYGIFPVTAAEPTATP
jgi:hypothetical protein